MPVLPQSSSRGGAGVAARTAAVTRRAVAAVTAVVCLAPYATVALPYRRALYAQAASIVLAVCALPIAAWVTGGGARRLRQVPPAIGAGLACYAGAALLATAVAVWRGNDPLLVVGQVVSMLLLPLAAVGALALPRAPARDAFTAALIAATAGAAALHLLHWGAQALRGHSELRLFFDNKVSVVGACLLALLLALAARTGMPVWRRRLAGGGAVLLALYVFGSGVRGLWLVTPLAVLAWLVLGHGGRVLFAARGWLAAAVAVLAAVGLWASATAWLDQPRPGVLPAAPAAGESVSWTAEEWTGAKRPPLRRYYMQAPRPGRTYALHGRFRGGSHGQAYAAVRWRDSRGRRLDALAIVSWPGASGREAVSFGVPPDGTARVELVASTRPGAGGTWSVEGLTLCEVGPAWIAPYASQLAYTRDRLASLGRLLTGRGGVDRSVSQRLAESRNLLARLRQSRWVSRLFGSGLGATFDAGRERGSGTNYVHNFYLFLLFKLGLVGTLLVLAAFVLWCRYLLVSLLARPPGAPPRVRGAAALSAWLGYLLWSVSSPEILDFRVAPLWGLLLAAAVADGSVALHPASVDLPDGDS